MAVRRIKNGQGGLPGDYLLENQNIPFLRVEQLQDNIKTYLRSGEMYIPRIQIIGSAGIGNSRLKTQQNGYGLEPIKAMNNSTNRSIDMKYINDFSTQPSTQIADNSKIINRQITQKLSKLPSIHEKSEI